MSLFSKITDKFKRSLPPVETTGFDAPKRVGYSATDEIDHYKKLQADRERMAILKTCKTMYAQDTRVKKAHRFYARDIVRAGFIVKTKNAAAKKVAVDLQKRIGLNQILEDAVRLTSRDGDSFYEVVVDENLLIIELSRKPTTQMRRNSDKRDKFLNPQKAFWQSDRTWFGLDAPQDAIWYADWQMIHARWEYDGETRYGTPMFASATGPYKKVVDGELNIAVRRKLGSAQIRQHVIEGSGSDVETYKEQNKSVFGKLAAVTDLFSNKKSSLTVHQGDGNVDKIGDVEHHVTTMMAASDVPEELIVGGSNLNRDILGEKKEEYEETLSQGREWLDAQILIPLLERQWLLAGILPASVDYEIVWRTAKPLTPADLRDLGDGLARLRLIGVSEDVIQQIAAMFLKGVDDEIMQMDGFSVDQFAQNLKGISV